jgi:hypothetical protein
VRWRQVSTKDSNVFPKRIELKVPQPKVAEIYYSCCAMTDRHNRCRQDDLMLKKKLGTMDWSMQVNMIILGMIIVDTWLALQSMPIWSTLSDLK